MEWINIKDIKPTLNQYCITYFPVFYMQSIEIGMFLGDDTFDYGDDFTRINCITHWMPLPNIPTYEIPLSMDIKKFEK
jgi:hypothetical protein